MNDPDHTIYYGTRLNPNPYEADAPTFTDQQIADEKSDQLERLFKDGELIVSTIFGEGFHDLHSAECHTLGNILAAIMTCKMDDRSEHIDSLRDLFGRPFDARATEMAKLQLESDYFERDRE